MSIKNHVLKQKRLALGYTIDRLAKMSGISGHYLLQLEKGLRKGTPNTWIKLSKVLDIPIKELLEQKNHPTSAHENVG